jgi:hypothetical protein
VNVSFSVSIVSLHLKLCKVCIEPEGNARGWRRGNFSVRNPLDLSYRDPLDARSAREIEVCTRRSSGGITLWESVVEIQESISQEKRRPEPSGT